MFSDCEFLSCSHGFRRFLIAVPDNAMHERHSADGYTAADLFFFGINTGVRLGYAHGSAWTAMVDPVAGVEAQALAPATGPWGSFSQLMVDQCQIGVHLVWCVTFAVGA